MYQVIVVSGSRNMVYISNMGMEFLKKMICLAVFTRK